MCKMEIPELASEQNHTVPRLQSRSVACFDWKRVRVVESRNEVEANENSLSIDFAKGIHSF